MQYPRCIFPSSDDAITFHGVVTRPLEGSARGHDAAATQTLVVCGQVLRPLTGADSHGGLELGPPLQLFAEPPAPRDGQLAAPRRPFVPSRIHGFNRSVWDPYSSAVYMVHGGAVLRLGSDDTVTVVAGDIEEVGNVDGPGGVARFGLFGPLASDGTGALYVGDMGRIRKLKLLPAEAGAGQGALTLAAAGPGPAAAAAAGGVPPGGRGAAGEEVVVSTLPLQLPPGPDVPVQVRGLAFDGGSGEVGCGGSLIYATRSALYRLSLGATTAAANPVLLAGAERMRDAVDGRGPDARFFQILGLAMDGEGAVWVADIDSRLAATAVRRVAVDGTVTTVTSADGCCWDPAILPSGRLTLCAEEALRVLDLGLKPPPSCIAAPRSPAPAGPPPRTLPGDFGALFERQPDGTADVTIVVGGRTFHVHRAVLCARSDYFRQRLGDAFADGCLQQLSLPDADPDVVELVLRFIYTGVVADIPAAQVQALAELAGRLLLPELCQLALALVEASVTASTVVGLLLWAEACERGPAFSELLSRLKAWYVEHHEAVLEEALDAVEQLAAANPKLVAELMQGCARASKRRRTC